MLGAVVSTNENSVFHTGRVCSCLVCTRENLERTCGRVVDDWSSHLSAKMMHAHESPYITPLSSYNMPNILLLGDTKGKHRSCIDSVHTFCEPLHYCVSIPTTSIIIQSSTTQSSVIADEIFASVNHREKNMHG